MSVYLPDFHFLLVLILAPFFAGVSTGLTGAGSAIMIQICWRFSENIIGADLGDGDRYVSSRRVLAISSIVAITQSPIIMYVLYKAAVKHYRKDIALVLFPGMNIVVWIGTAIAVYVKSVWMTITLGTLLLCISMWQFYAQNILNRHVDDEQVKNQALQLVNAPLPPIINPSHGVSAPLTQQTHTHDHDRSRLQTNTVDSQDSQYRRSSFGDNDLIVNEDLASLDVLSSSTLQTHTHTHTQTSTTAHTESSVLDLDDDKTQHSSSSPSSSSVVVEHRLFSSAWWVDIFDQCKQHKEVSIAGLFVGCMSGLLGGVFGINGPPVLMYLAYLDLNGTVLRDTCTLVFFLNLPCIQLARIIFNIYRAEEIVLYLLALPANLLGLRLGYMLHPHIPSRKIQTLLQLIIFLSSIPLTEPADGSVFGWVILGVYLVCVVFVCVYIYWRCRRDDIIRRGVMVDHLLNGEQNDFVIE